MVPMPPVVVLIVCRAILGEPDDNSKYTKHIPSEWDLAQGVMHCRRMEVQLYDPGPDAGATAQPFSTFHCNRAGVTQGAQFDVDNWNKPWRFWRAACPVPVMNDNGTPDNPRDDTIVGWAIPPCPEKRGVLECESDTAI